MMKMKNATCSVQHVPDVHRAPAAARSRLSVTLPASSSTGIERHAHRDLVGDHLRARAQAAEQRVLVVRRPAGEHDAVDAERGDREDEQEADRQVGATTMSIVPHGESAAARANGITAQVDASPG